MSKTNIEIDLTGIHTKEDIIVGTYGVLIRYGYHKFAERYYDLIQFYGLNKITYDKVLQITKQYVKVIQDEKEL